jgi:hypothetical protein
MTLLDQTFDKYNMRARIFPAVVLVLPLWIGVCAWFPFDNKLFSGGLMSLGAVALAFIVSDWVRRRGKFIQDDLFQSWGGLPSVLMLSFAHSTITRDTLGLCHEKCKELLPGRDFPATLAVESASQDEYFKTYRMCSDRLNELTRDSKKYPLVFEENVRYGMRRNYLGIRSFGIALAIIGLGLSLGRVIYRWRTVGEGDQIAIVGTLICVAILLVWIWIVNSEWVKEQAFEYAKRLILATQGMDQKPG